MTKRKKRPANLGGTNVQETQQMANGETWNGIPTTGPPNSNVIMVPETCPHYYDENGNLQVVASPEPPGPPPPQYQAPGYHNSSSQPINTTQPQAVFDSSGVCTSAGWTPGGVWYCVGDKSEHPCSNGGPIAAAKRDAINNIIVWAFTLAALNNMAKPTPQ